MQISELLVKIARELERAVTIIKLYEMLESGKTLEQAIEELKRK